MGGEKLFWGLISSEVKGSPPRGRGKVRRAVHRASGAGITPAWAGKSGITAPCVSALGDHPRVGGEKFILSIQPSDDLGSPPRGRGKGIFHGDSLHEIGITPAWAGKSRCSSSRCQRHWDHPRVGGEKSSTTRPQHSPPGSPPRGRGKVLDVVRFVGLFGITPAWAGKSFSTSSGCASGRDHPRVGGEKWEYWMPKIGDQGSPPRGRGKVLLRILRVSGVGITPAWAGKRRGLERRAAVYQDHPRVGGEKCDWFRPCRSDWGSPPRGRGKDHRAF